MSNPNDGGPAFPFPSGPEPRVNEFHDRCEGMTLRDWFAGQALAGYSAQVDERRCPPDRTSADEWRAEMLLADATWCYKMADAMIAARERRAL